MELHFEVSGQGESLIILHGLFGSLENWRGISKSLSQYFKVFCVDQRNHGSSPHSSQMDYRLMATDILELLERQGQVDALLLGHSMGGKAAKELALLHPQAVRKLVVVDIAPRAYPPLHERAITAMLALDLTRFKSRKDIEDALAPGIPDVATRQFLLKNVTRTEQGGFRWKIGLTEIADNYARLTQNVSGVEPFRKPTLFVRGERSDFILDADLDAIRNLFPCSHLHTIPGAGHLLHVEKANDFILLLLEFLRST